MKKVFTLLVILCMALTACSTGQEIQTLIAQSSVSSAPVEDEQPEPIQSVDEPGETPDRITGEILTITSFDGVRFDERLCLPDSGSADKLVIYINGSGPNTYENRRSWEGVEFLYHDLFASELNDRGIAYFSYNTRGVTLGSEAPLYADIDPVLYQTYIPSNEIKDIPMMIDRLLEHHAFGEDTKVYLLGWSAGAILSPAVALEGMAKVDALLLAGYPNDTLEQTLIWQQSGGSSMVFYRQYFDYDGSGDISREEFEEDRNGIFGGSIDFDDMDANKDGVLTADDFDRLLTENREAIFGAFNNGDDDWIAENYGATLTSAWYQNYKNFSANADTVPKLDLPIHVFHGVYDGSCDVQGVYDLQAEFARLGKQNLTVHIYEDADHDLNYSQYLLQGTVPEGIADIIAVCEALDVIN